MQLSVEVLIYMAGFLLLLLLLRLLRKPFRFILRILISTLLGGTGLLLLNTFGGALGISLAVNPVTALIAGVLGLPGIAALLFIKLWL